MSIPSMNKSKAISMLAVAWFLLIAPIEGLPAGHRKDLHHSPSSATHNHGAQAPHGAEHNSEGRASKSPKPHRSPQIDGVYYRYQKSDKVYCYHFTIWTELEPTVRVDVSFAAFANAVTPRKMIWGVNLKNPYATNPFTAETCRDKKTAIQANGVLVNYMGNEMTWWNGTRLREVATDTPSPPQLSRPPPRTTALSPPPPPPPSPPSPPLKSPPPPPPPSPPPPPPPVSAPHGTFYCQKRLFGLAKSYIHVHLSTPSHYVAESFHLVFQTPNGRRVFFVKNVPNPDHKHAVTAKLVCEKTCKDYMANRASYQAVVSALVGPSKKQSPPFVMKEVASEAELQH